LIVYVRGAQILTAQYEEGVGKTKCGIGAVESSEATTDGRQLGQGTAETAQNAKEDGGNEGQDVVSPQVTG
jgi:hypothetical protein